MIEAITASTSASVSFPTRPWCKSDQRNSSRLAASERLCLQAQLLGAKVCLRRKCGTLRGPVSMCCMALAEAAESQLDGALSARERRKQRNEKRQELAEKKATEQDQLQDEMSRRKRKPVDWDQLLDQNRLATYGLRWWMLQVASQSETSVAEELTQNFNRVYPGRPFQAMVPVVPIFNTSEDGSVTLTKQKLFPGTVLVQCQLDKDTIAFILSVYKARVFIGHMVGPRFREQLVPSPVAPEEIERVLASVREGEQEEERLRLKGHLIKTAPARQQKKAKKKGEEEAASSSGEPSAAGKGEKRTRAVNSQLRRVLEAGATVRVTAGPFVNCIGKVDEVMPEKERVKVILTIFGRLTPVELKLSEVFVTVAEEEKKEKGVPMVDIR